MSLSASGNFTCAPFFGGHATALVRCTLQVPEFVALALAQLSSLGEQANLAILGVDKKLFRVPYNYAIDKLVLFDFHHINGHLAGN